MLRHFDYIMIRITLLSIFIYMKGIMINHELPQQDPNEGDSYQQLLDDIAKLGPASYFAGFLLPGKEVWEANRRRQQEIEKWGQNHQSLPELTRICENIIASGNTRMDIPGKNQVAKVTKKQTGFRINFHNGNSELHYRIPSLTVVIDTEKSSLEIHDLGERLMFSDEKMQEVIQLLLVE